MIVRTKLKKPDKVNKGVLVHLEKKGGFLDRVWMSYGQTIQVRDYEPSKVDVGMASDVAIDETVEEALDRVSAIIGVKIKGEIKELINAKNKKRRT